MRHVFSCLVHENVECAVDLIQNLRFFEPESSVLVYDGSGGKMSEHTALLARTGAVVHPESKRMSWGRLHDSVFDCLEYGLARFSFDAITFVDSDQLMTGRGYLAALAAALERQPDAGILGTPNPSVGNVWATKHEEQERELWAPFLDRYPRGRAQQYPANWIFWPGTVITASAARALCELRSDPELTEILERSNFASEEIGFATAAAALGHKVVPKPWHDDWVRWRRPIRPWEVDSALADPNCFWVHPVGRRSDDESRAYLRAASNLYAGFTPTFAPEPPPRPPVHVRLKRRATDGFFRLVARRIDGLAANEARAALARARRTQS